MNRECVLPNTCKDIPVTFTSMTIYDVNDSEFPPVNGAYFNTIVTYKMTGHTYMYDSDGVPTLMNDMSLAVDDALSTTSKNPVQNKVITQALGQVTTDTDAQITEVKTQIVNEAEARARADTALSTQISTTEQTLNENLTNAINDVNTAITTGLSSKVDKVEGKGLSSNDFTDADKEKLAGVQAGAQANPENVSAFTNDAGYITGADVDTTVEDAVNTATEAINSKLDKNVVQSIRIDDTTSTDVISLVNGTVNIGSGETSSSEIPLPVASADSAGVINPSIYNSIQDSAEKVDVILNGAVVVTGLAAEPTQEQLTTAWKTATGRTDVINGAKIYDQANDKTWTYYTNTTTWYAAGNSGTGTISQFTNETAGIVKGSTQPGQLFAEADGTGSVNNWDETQSRIANLENNQYELPIATPSVRGGIRMNSTLGNNVYLLNSIKWGLINHSLQIVRQIPAGNSYSTSVVIPLADEDYAGLISREDKAKIDNMPEFEVVASANDPGEGSKLAANKVIFVVEG